MNKFLAILFSSFIGPLVWACPMCAGSDTNESEKYIIYVLGAFIVLAYIPMYVMFRIIKNNQ
jgi:hypothetical protein